MATTTIRWQVAKTIVDSLRNSGNLAGVLIEPGYPGAENLRPDSIWVDELEGDIDIPVYQGGRKQRDDKFTIPFEIRVVDRTDLDATQTRLSQIVAVFEDVFANDPSLGRMDGVVAAQISHERQTVGWIPDGPVGFAEITVSVHVRLL